MRGKVFTMQICSEFFKQLKVVVLSSVKLITNCIIFVYNLFVKSNKKK